MRNSRTRATAADADRAYALIQECSDWLRQQGISQWSPPYPRQRFDHEVAAGEVWFWSSTSGVDATVTLLATRPDYYPADVWPEPTNAWYICRFAVARRLRGAQLGPRILAELESDARLAGVTALRLDVSADNPFLTEYYTAQGFQIAHHSEMLGNESIFLQRVLG